MDRRANLRLARTMPKARQGLGVPQPQGARLPQARFHPPHDAKTMQFKMMFPDRLYDLVFNLRPAGAPISAREAKVVCNTIAVRTLKGEDLAKFMKHREDD